MDIIAAALVIVVCLFIVLFVHKMMFNIRYHGARLGGRKSKITQGSA